MNSCSVADDQRRLDGKGNRVRSIATLNRIENQTGVPQFVDPLQQVSYEM